MMYFCYDVTEENSLSKLEIQLLGNFRITYEDRVISEQSKRSKKLWSLLQYLIVHHDRQISQNELIELLWENEKSENPLGALKTQMHRARATLKELNIGEEVIISIGGTYAFNNKLDFSIDAEDFERLCKQSRNETDSTKKLEICLNALELYKGDFLPKSTLEQWVMPIYTYYKSLFVRTVHDTIEMLDANNDKAKIIEICRQAVILDPYDEKIHYYLIKALSDSGEQAQAKEHYDYVTNLFYTKFGVNPANELIALYNDTVKTTKNIEISIKDVTMRLNEIVGETGAFYCEYEVFRRLYIIEVRSSRRYNKNINICLITISDSDGLLPEQKLLNKSMEQLHDCISTSLRDSDIFARYSLSQFIIMLPNTDNNNGDLIMNRIIANYRKSYPRTNVILSYQFQPIA